MQQGAERSEGQQGPSGGCQGNSVNHLIKKGEGRVIGVISKEGIGGQSGGTREDAGEGKFGSSLQLVKLERCWEEK